MIIPKIDIHSIKNWRWFYVHKQEKGEYEMKIQDSEIVIGEIIKEGYENERTSQY